MELSEFLQLENRAHIISVIERASLFGGDLWQSEVESNMGRHLYQIIQIQHDTKSDKLFFRLPTIIKLSPDQTLFIKLNYRNIIFRLYPGQFKVHGDKISCSYPSQARAFEERKGGDRFVLPYSADLSHSLKKIERKIREITYEIEIRIIDVSEKGFGVLISGANRDYLKKNDHFWLKAVDHRSLRSPILGSVKYVASKGYYLKRGDVRVGLALSAPLAKETLELLKKKSIIVLSA